MELEQSIRQLAGRLSAASINYAVIGGMAMALRGIQRTTFDLDFLLMLSDLERTHKILLEEGYACVYQSENVSHYSKSGGGLTRVDVLHAFRGPSLSMLGCVLEIKRRDVERKTGSPKAAEAEMGQRPMPPRATPGQPVSLPPFGPGRSRDWAALGARDRAFQAQHPRPRLAPALLRSRRRASLFPRHTLGLWEKINNPDFKGVDFDPLLRQAGSNSFTLSPAKWIEPN